MDLNLKLLLINRLLVKAGHDPLQEEYYQLTYVETEISAVTWVHATVTEPTQLELDAENEIYQDELLIETLRPRLMEVLLRIDVAWDINGYWQDGNYSEVIWQDVFDYNSNEEVRTNLEAAKILLGNEKAELEAIVSPTQDDLDRIDELTLLIQEKTTEINALPTINITTKPSYDAVKTEYKELLAEEQAAKEKRLQEEADFKDMDVDLLLPHMLGNQVEYSKMQGKHWDDLEIRTNEVKPTFADAKLAWTALQLEVVAQEQKLSRKEKGKLARVMCDEVLDIIAGHNMENALTSAQKDQMTLDFAQILKALSEKRPAVAHGMISAIVPDGTIVTADLKTELLETLDLSVFA